jgi:DNA (cytosine-5)-methyltransferase 1
MTETVLPDNKPPYQVPTMAEVNALLPNGLTVISTFAGAGGSSLGYRMAGFRVLAACEFVPHAVECYRLNATPETVLLTEDIRQLTGEAICQAAGVAVGVLDVLDGSPPCQPFSTAGKREATWGKVRQYGDHAQRADDLFFEFIRLVKEMKPKVFVAENVSGLVKGTAKGYFKEILTAMKAAGYRTTCRVLDAQWLGVPQMRQRVIFIGVREDLKTEPAFPKPLSYRYSLREALPYILQHGTAPSHADWEASGRDAEATMVDSSLQPAPCITALAGERQNKGIGLVIEGANGFNSHGGYGVDQPMATVQAGRPGRVSRPEAAARVIHDTGGWVVDHDVTDQPCPTVTVGVNSLNACHYRVEEPYELLPPSRQKPGAFNTTKLTLDSPCPTVTVGSPGNDLAVPIPARTERRKFTIDELKAVCSFPADFRMTGSYAEQWARLGNAVPPLMMKAIASVIRDEVLAR